MAREPITDVIDDIEVTVTKFAAIRGSQVNARILRIIVPALGAIADTIPAIMNGKVEDLLRHDIADIMPAFERLLAALDESTIESLLTSVLASASVVIRDGANATKYDLTSAAMINRAFDDRELTMWKVWWFALKANFRPFGSALAGLGDRRPTT